MSQECSLLLVEDDLYLLEELREFLSDFFSTIDVATSAEAALMQFETRHYDLVISDIQLPKQSGLFLIEQIKKRYPSQLVIVISAYQEVDYFLKSIELGIYSFLLKPFNSQQLINTMIKVTTLIKQKYHRKESSTVVLHSGVTFDLKTKELRIDDEAQELTSKEELLLALLVRNLDISVRNEQIAHEVWQSSEVNNSTLRALVKRLRDKLGYEDAICNLKNRGYKLNTMP